MDLVCLYLFVCFIFINDIFNMAFTFANLRSFISFPNEENILLKIILPWKKNQQISEILHFVCHFLWVNISKCHVVENKESWRLRIQHHVMIQKMISLCYFKVSYSFLYLSTVRWSFKSHSIWLCSSTCLTCKQKSLTSLTHWCCPSVVANLWTCKPFLLLHSYSLCEERWCVNYSSLSCYVHDSMVSIFFLSGFQNSLA